MAAIGALEASKEIVHNQAFNVGKNTENYQMRPLAEIVGETVPNCEIKFADGAEPDKRNYGVDFSKYTQAFSEHELRWNARRGAKQIYEAYRTVGLPKGEQEGLR